jgi:transposase
MAQFIGLDVGHDSCHLCIVNNEGQLVEERQVRTDRSALERTLRGLDSARVLLETGSESAWIARLVEASGHVAVTCHARRLRVIAESTLKCDRLDAERLARLARLSALDAALLPAVHVRGESAQRVRAVLRVRLALVRQRTAIVNVARGLGRTQGQRLPGVKPRSLPGHVEKAERLPAEFKELVNPLMASVGSPTEQIEALNQQVEEMAQADPVSQRLQSIPGVGALTAVGYVACLEDPTRFHRSREVGPYLGLRPRLRQSGGMRHEGRIAREGDTMLRHLLVQAAHSLLNTKKDSDLKRWGTQLQRRVGRQKAAVAVARKLAVLMHRLWVSGETYQPQRARPVH